MQIEFVSCWERKVKITAVCRRAQRVRGEKGKIGFASERLWTDPF